MRVDSFSSFTAQQVLEQVFVSTVTTLLTACSPACLALAWPRTQVEREINIHVGLLHESIVKLYAAFEVGPRSPWMLTWHARWYTCSAVPDHLTAHGCCRMSATCTWFLSLQKEGTSSTR